MAQQKIHPLIIIGSGPAGLTAGIYASRANLQPIIIEGKTPGGQLMSTTAVENWPGNKSIMGPKLMMDMKDHAEHFGCTFVSGDVASVDFSQKPFKVVTDDKKELFAHAVIIATGATPKRLGIPGEDTFWGHGVTTCAVCDGAFYKDVPVVIVGGGDTAMEDASFMTNFTDKITIVQIGPALTASAAMQQRVINNPKISIIYNSTATEIRGNDEGVTELVITNQQTKAQQSLKTKAVFVAIGLRPNTGAFKGAIALNNAGYLVLEDETKTSVEGVFGAGDIADYRYRQAITAAGAGCKAALDAERYLKTIL